MAGGAKWKRKKRIEEEYSTDDCSESMKLNVVIHNFKLMSIVLSVHPGVQLDTRVDSKKSFAVRSWKGPSGI